MKNTLLSILLIIISFRTIEAQSPTLTLDNATMNFTNTPYFRSLGTPYTISYYFSQNALNAPDAFYSYLNGPGNYIGPTLTAVPYFPNNIFRGDIASYQGNIFLSGANMDFSNLLYDVNGNLIQSTARRSVVNWNGEKFLDLPQVNDGAAKMITHNGEVWLYYPGTTYHLLKFNGTAWTEVSIPTNSITTLFSNGTDLFIASHFSGSNGQTVKVFRYDSGTWTQMGSTLSGFSVNCMYVFNGEMYIGGDFSGSASAAAIGIAKWSGTDWINVGQGVTGINGISGNVLTMKGYHGELFVGGSFTHVDGTNINADNIARWTGSSWKTAGTLGHSSGTCRINSLEVFNDKLYVGGKIDYSVYTYRWFGRPTQAVPSDKVLQWQEFDDIVTTDVVNEWKPIGFLPLQYPPYQLPIGNVDEVYSLKVLNNNLYVFGNFLGGVAVYNDNIPTPKMEFKEMKSYCNFTTPWELTLKDVSENSTDREWIITMNDNSNPIVINSTDPEPYIQIPSLYNNGYLMVTLIAKNAFHSNSYTYMIKGGQFPPPVPIVNISSSATTICNGTNVTFTAVPINGGANPVYKWTLNGNNVGTNSSTYQNSSLNNNDVVTCTMTPDAHCTTNGPVTSNSVTMTVNPVLPVGINIVASPSNTICQGTNVTFTATVTNGGSIPLYQWKVDGVNVGTNSSVFSISTLNNGQVVTCILTSNAVCPLGNPATSNPITMVVNPNLPVSVSIAPSPSTNICQGTSVTFTATATNGGSTPVYQWKVDGVNTGTNNPVFSSSSLTNGQVVTCVLTSNAICPLGNPATSNSIVMTVDPNLPLSVSIAVSPSDTICMGAGVAFIATAINGGSSPIYQWKVNSVNMGINSSTYSSSSLANGDLVSCVVTSSSACSNVKASNVVSMQVSANITLGTTSFSSLCLGSSVNIPYTTCGIFDTGNIFTAQLSDASGSFNNAVNIGSSTLTSGSISGTLPLTAQPSNLYKIRIISSSPAFISNLSGSFTIVNDCGSLIFNSSSNQKATIPLNSLYNFGLGNFTLEAEVNFSNVQTSATPVIISTRSTTSNGLLFSTSNSGTKLQLMIAGTPFYSNVIPSIHDNSCHHIAVVRTKVISGTSGIAFYLDGQSIGNYAFPEKIVAGGMMYLGNDQFSMPLNGSISYFRIWNIARSPSQISSNINTNYMPGNSAGLIGYWDFNEGTGQTIYDVSSTANNGLLGTNSGTESVDPSRGVKCFTSSMNTALSFDGVDDKAVIPDNASYILNGGDFTIEAEINMNSSQSYSTVPILSKRTAGTSAGGFLFSTTNGGTQLAIQIGGSVLSSSVTSTLYGAGCTHVAVTKNSNVIAFYKNGSLISSGTLSGNISLAAPLLIGHDDFNASTFNGIINEVRLWNTGKTGLDLSSNIQTFYSSSTANLIGDWRFKEVSDELIYDGGLLGNNGYLGNNSTQFDTQNPIRVINSCFSGDRLGLGSNTIDSHQTEENSTLEIYPNPADNIIHAVISLNQKEITWRVINSLGNIMEEGKIKDGDRSWDIITKEYPSGIYIIKVEGEEVIYKRCLIIH